MIDPIRLQRISDWLEECRRPLLVSHRRADGDALGALAGMALALRQKNIDARVALFEPLPERYALLASAIQWQVWHEAREELTNECDAVVVLDTCALAQLEPIAEYLERAPRTLVIDHHATSDPIATRAGDLRVFDETAAATSLIIAEWMKAAGLRVDRALATALFVGIATDCGWFRFSNTDARVLGVAAELVEAGADPNAIHQVLYQQEPAAKLRLIGRMLNGLELHADGKLAVMALRPADFAATGADHSMTEDLVNEAIRIGSVEAVVMFTEQADGLVRVNFRSKEKLDVARLAGVFGGGGHARAAGARIRGDWDQVVPRVIAEAARAVQATVAE